MASGVIDFSTLVYLVAMMRVTAASWAYVHHPAAISRLTSRRFSRHVLQLFGGLEISSLRSLESRALIRLASITLRNARFHPMGGPQAACVTQNACRGILSVNAFGFVTYEPPSKIISMLTVGSQGIYEWLVSDRQFDLLRICPDVVLEKYIAITSFDSGPLVPTNEEKAAGWESRSNVAYSPKIQDVASVPRSEYDEWYIFGRPVDLGTSHLGENVFEVSQEPGHVSVFVNYGFALHPPDRTSLASLFWPQMERIRPESYVADNDYLTFVSANQALFVSVLNAVKAVS